MLIVGGFATIYCVMRQRKKKMQLQQALAEGKITMKELEEQELEEMRTEGNDVAPDKEVGDISSSPYG